MHTRYSDTTGQLLHRQAYASSDVVTLAPSFLGKRLTTVINQKKTSVIISEVEAYAAPEDQASHAKNGRRTPRTEAMYADAGTAYIYICYGVHHLFNIITGPEGLAHAILVRAGIPTSGIDIMLERRNLPKMTKRLTTGPGALGQALGIAVSQNGHSLLSQDGYFYIEDIGMCLAANEISTGPRVGVAGAGPTAAALPYRFWIRNEKYVSNFRP